MDTFKVDCKNNETARLVVATLRNQGYRWTHLDNSYRMPNSAIHIFSREGRLSKGDSDFESVNLHEKHLSEIISNLCVRWSK